MIRAKCGVCPAVIVWGRTVNGRAMPVDFDPSPDGNVRLSEVPGETAPLAEVLGPLERELEPEGNAPDASSRHLS